MFWKLTKILGVWEATTYGPEQVTKESEVVQALMDSGMVREDWILDDGTYQMVTKSGTIAMYGTDLKTMCDGAVGLYAALQRAGKATKNWSNPHQWEWIAL